MRDLESACTCAAEWPVARTNPKVTTSAPAASVIKVTAPTPVQVQPDLARRRRSSTRCSTRITELDRLADASSKMGEKAFAQQPGRRGALHHGQRLLQQPDRDEEEPELLAGSQGCPTSTDLTFKSVSGDEAAYEAMLAGEGQVYGGMSTPQLLQRVRAALRRAEPARYLPYDLQLNTAVAPFNNLKAREAIYATTNFAPILQHIFGNAVPGRRGLHRARRHLLPAERARLPGLRPDPGQAAGPGVRPGQGDDQPRHDQLLAGRAGDHPGARRRSGRRSA